MGVGRVGKKRNKGEKDEEKEKMGEEEGKIVVEDLCYHLILDFQHPAQGERASVA